MQQMIIIKRYIPRRYCVPLMMTRTKCKFKTTCWIEIKSQIQNLQQFSNLFSSNRWTRKEPRSPRERIHHVHSSATTRIDFMDLSKGTDGTTARSFRRPPTTIGNGPQSGHLRQGTRWIADETKGEGWKERKNTKGKPEFLLPHCWLPKRFAPRNQD